MEDILKHPQLEERGFWKDIEHPDLGTSFKFPGGAVMTTQGYVGPKSRAPHIGEHNAEIYGELGVDASRRADLKAKGVI